MTYTETSHARDCRRRPQLTQACCSREINATVRSSPKPAADSSPPAAGKYPWSARSAVSCLRSHGFFFFFFLTNHGLQEETAAALHSYDQWDPCGEGEQLQVPRCKHLRGPDLDYTHSNTGQESQTKTVPSATAEKIQGLTSYPENFQFRGHRKCINSVHLSVVW